MTQTMHRTATWRGMTIAKSDHTVEVGGYIYFPRDTVRMDLLESTAKTPHDLECRLVGGGQHHRRGDARLQRLLPAVGAQAPAFARLQAREAVLRPRRAQVVAPRAAEGEEFYRHLGADDVDAEVVRAGVTAAGAVEAGQGRGAA